MRKVTVFSLAIILTITTILLSGDTAERRSNVHSGNQISTSFYNYGLLGRRLGHVDDVGLEWPINSGHEYLGDFSVIVGAEATAPGGSNFFSAEVPESPRGSNEFNPDDPNEFWGWEPLPGFANSSQNFVAMNHMPSTWPASWNGWLGIPGYAGIADQEAFFVMDDATDREFFLDSGFLPDSTNATRYGMGWEVRVHSYQFKNPFLENALYFTYNIFNTGTTFYPKTFFSALVGTTIGGNGDTSDDNVGFDLEKGLVYAFDTDNIGTSNGSSFSPVGYMGIVFLETPGIDFDGIDNDGDGSDGAGSVIDESVLLSHVAQTGEPIVIIDYSDYSRTVSTLADTGVSFVFNGQTFTIMPGDTLRELLNGVDDNLNGLIDELTEIPGNGIDDNENGLVDEPNPHFGKKYVDYFSGNGANNPLIDESKFDGIDNDGDWNPATDDVGLDGVPNTNDAGEGDGIATSGAGTGQPGEPHIDLTDPDEADQVGLTSLFTFKPFNLVRLRNDDQLAELATPGFFDNALQNDDTDIYFGSGFFPSKPGDSLKIALAFVMGNDFDNLLFNVKSAKNTYRENFVFPPLEITTNFPAAGARIVGDYSLDLNIDNANPDYKWDIFYSNDRSETFQLLADSLTNPANYTWQTANFPDGIFYKLRAVAYKDSFFTPAESDSFFTIDNPGNAAPIVFFTNFPNIARDTTTISWFAGDPEDDPLNVALFSSLDQGASWQLMAENLQAIGSYSFDSRQFPNTLPFSRPPILIKLEVSDGEFSESIVKGLEIGNPFTFLPDSLIIHRYGNGDGSVGVLVNDSTSLTGDLYQISFTTDQTNQKFYSVTNLTDSITIFENLSVNGSSPSPVFDGIYLLLHDPSAFDVVQEETGWNRPQINVPFEAKRLSEGLAQGVAYPADYDILFSDQIIDTSDAFTIPGLPPFVPTPVEFTIYNISENRPADFALLNIPPIGNTAERDFIVILENIDGQTEPTWNIIFSYPDSLNLVQPTLDDTFHLEILEPFSAQDVYWFSTEPFIVGIPGEKIPLADNFQLAQNYPNPFNPETHIRFSVPKIAKVKLEVFNILGQRVSTLINKKMNAGTHEITFHPENLSSGIYFYRLTTTGFQSVKKMLLLR